MKHVFIVNPVSGKADASLYLLPRLIDAAAGAGVDYAVELTQHAGHAAEIARQYGDDGGPVRLYACGGDGTLNEVFTGAYPYKNAEVASVPCGSGNDFVRNFGAAEDFLSLADNIAGTAVPVDLVAANGGVSAAICSVGLDSEVAYSIPKYRRLPLCGGQMAYNISIVERFLQPMGHRLRITVDDDVLEGDYLIATVCNGVAYGGGFRAAPMADLQDGVLDVIMVKKMSRMRIAGVLSKYKNGLHYQNGRVVPELSDVLEYRRAQKVLIEPMDGKAVITNIDGECTPADSLSAQVLPLAARFVLPAPLYAQFEDRAPAVTA